MIQLNATEISIDQVKGQVVSGIFFSFENQMMIVFEDHTFTTIGVDEDSDICVELGPIKLDPFCFGDRILFEAGIVTAEQLREGRKTSSTAAEESQRRMRKRLYETLKKEFEK